MQWDDPAGLGKGEVGGKRKVKVGSERSRLTRSFRRQGVEVAEAAG